MINSRYILITLLFIGLSFGNEYQSLDGIPEMINEPDENELSLLTDVPNNNNNNNLESQLSSSSGDLIDAEADSTTIATSKTTCEKLNWGSVFSNAEILNKIHSMIPEFDTKGLEPAIPIHDLKKYQQLPLTDCEIINGEFKFQVEVPAKPKNQDYQLFNFPIGSFSFETDEGICYFDYPTKGIIETTSDSNIFPLTEEEFQKCVESNICKIPASSSSYPSEENYGDYACLKAVFSGKTGKELAPFCKFHCHPRPNISKDYNENTRKEISESFFFSWILK